MTSRQEALQFRACLLICMLAGSHVAQVDAMRQQVPLFKRVATMQEFQTRMDSFVQQAHAMNVPSNDDGCTMAGALGHGTCEPQKYCVYQRSWLGMRRDKSCHLKAIYRPDDDLSQMFAENSAELISRAEYFRSHARVSQLWMMRKNVNVIGIVGNAASSDVPAPKLNLTELTQGFHHDTISDYLQSLKTFLPANNRAFEHNTFSEESLSALTFNRTMDSIEKGMESNRALRLVKKKFDLGKLMEVITAPSEDPAVLHAQIKSALPGIDEARLEKLMKEWKAWGEKVKSDCDGDATCESETVLEQRENLMEKLDEGIKHNAHGALMDVTDSDDVGTAAAFLALEEKVENEEDLEGNPVLLKFLVLVIFIALAAVIAALVTSCLLVASCLIPVLIIASILIFAGTPEVVILGR